MSGWELPAGWETAEIADVSDVGGGLTKNSNRSSLSLRRPYLRVANVYANELRLSDVAEIGVTEAEAQRTTLEVGDVLVVEGNGSVDQIGRVAMWDGSIKGCLHQNHLIRVRSRAVIRPNFLLQWLLSPEGRRAIERKASSSAGLHTLSISKVASLPLPVPPLPEQRRIVEKIEALTAHSRRAREALDALPALIDRYRQSILAAAFRGDLTAKWRENNRHRADVAGLLREIESQRLRDAMMKKRRDKDAALPDFRNPLPVIPDNWKWVSVDQICECLDHMRVPVKKEDRLKQEGDVYPYYGANGQVGSIDGYIFDEELVLVTEDETFYGRTKPISYRISGKCWVNNHAHVLRARQPIQPDFLYLSLMHYNVLPWLTGTTGRAKLTKSALMSLPVALPPLEEMRLIVNKVKQAFRFTDSIAKQIESLRAPVSTLDQSILAKAFRGKLVPQDPNDEPASVLLERIRAERAAAGEKPRRGRARKAG
ncbi:restriction endonuclease subunit S [Azospirillum argentinense]